jgi:hypothetical protein
LIRAFVPAYLMGIAVDQLHLSAVVVDGHAGVVDRDGAAAILPASVQTASLPRRSWEWPEKKSIDVRKSNRLSCEISLGPRMIIATYRRANLSASSSWPFRFSKQQLCRGLSSPSALSAL